MVYNDLACFAMNLSDEITLNAFLTALEQLAEADETLPPNVQKHLTEVGKQIEMSSTAIAYLDAIAPQYPSLNQAYMKARSACQAEANERNQLGQTESRPPLADESNHQLKERACAIFQASDSVAAAKAARVKNTKGGWQGVFPFFKKD